MESAAITHSLWKVLMLYCLWTQLLFISSFTDPAKLLAKPFGKTAQQTENAKRFLFQNNSFLIPKNGWRLRIFVHHCYATHFYYASRKYFYKDSFISSSVHFTPKAFSICRVYCYRSKKLTKVIIRYGNEHDKLKLKYFVQILLIMVDQDRGKL